MKINSFFEQKRVTLPLLLVPTGKIKHQHNTKNLSKAIEANSFQYPKKPLGESKKSCMLKFSIELNPSNTPSKNPFSGPLSTPKSYSGIFASCFCSYSTSCNLIEIKTVL